MSILPIPSFLDDIKEKGFRKAVFELVDSTVHALTPGMNIQDLREVWRGEAPSRRPNPRLTPHADAFWMHMRPSYYHEAVTGMYPTFRLGFLSVYFFVVEIITGLFLMIFYTPSPEAAYSNMLNIMTNVPLGQFMRDLHRLGAEGMVLFVALHTIRTFASGSYKKPRQFTWFTGMLLLFMTLFLSFSGYLLPWDQLAFWAVTIGTSMAEAAPPKIVGENVNLLLRGAPDIGAGGLLRFYLLHVFLVPMLTAIFIGVHYYKVVLHGIALPPKLDEIGQDTAKRVPMDKRVYFTPDVATTEGMIIGVTTLILVIMCIWFFHAPLESHANPQVTPLHTTAPWYFLWLQGLLKVGDKVFWGLVVPSVLLGTFMVYPWLDTQISRRFAHRRIALSLMCGFCFIMFLLTYMGTGKWGVATSADQEIAQDIAPMEGVGPARAVPFDEYVNGTYCTSDLDKSHNLPLVWWGGPAAIASSALPDITKSVACQAAPAEGGTRKLLEKYKEEVKHWAEGKLGEPIGILVISEPQKDLKRIDIRIIWQVPEVDASNNPLKNTDGTMKLKLVESDFTDKGEKGDKRMVPALNTSGKTVYVHRYSEYQGGGH